MKKVILNITTNNFLQDVNASTTRKVQCGSEYQTDLLLAQYSNGPTMNYINLDVSYAKR